MAWPPEVTALAAGLTGIAVGAAFGIYYGKIIGENIGFEAAKWAYSYNLFGSNESLVGAQAQQANIAGQAVTPPGPYQGGFNSLGKGIVGGGAGGVGIV